MRFFLRLIIVAALFIASCKKKAKQEILINGTVLLTEIINNNPASSTYNKPYVDFYYKGKQLNEAVFYNYATGYSETHTFNYDSQGNLTGTIITNPNPAFTGDVSSTVTYTANNISEIKFYKAGKVLDQDAVFTYQNGNLTQCVNTLYNSATPPTPTNFRYTYVNSKNAVSQYTGAGLYGLLINFDTFDDKNSISQALPFFMYFVVDLQNQHYYMPEIPGINNPVHYDTSPSQGGHGGGDDIYTYSAYGYPVTASITENIPYIVLPLGAGNDDSMGLYKYQYNVVP